MLHKFIICLILSLLVFALGQEFIQPGPPDLCLKAKSIHINEQYHKEVPSPEGSDFPECQSWKEYSCCTQALTEILHRNRVIGLYNFSHVLCGGTSPLCEEYLLVCKIAAKCLTTASYLSYCYKYNPCSSCIDFAERALTHIS